MRKKLTKNQRAELSHYLHGLGAEESEIKAALSPGRAWENYRKFQDGKPISVGGVIFGQGQRWEDLNAWLRAQGAGVGEPDEEDLKPVGEGLRDDVAKKVERSDSRAKPSPKKAMSKRRGRGPGKKPRKVTTSVQVEPEMLDRLQVLAEQEERTVSALIRLALRDYLDKKGG